MFDGLMVLLAMRSIVQKTALRYFAPFATASPYLGLLGCPPPRHEGRASGLVEFGKYFARDTEAVDARGNAGVDRNLHEDFANLGAAYAVGERALDVGPQFMRPVEDRDHREIEHAAGLARQF